MQANIRDEYPKNHTFPLINSLNTLLDYVRVYSISVIHYASNSVSQNAFKVDQTLANKS